jgi:hypothetical protein
VFEGEDADDEPDIGDIAAEQKGQKVVVDLTCGSLISLPTSETMPSHLAVSECVLFFHHHPQDCLGCSPQLSFSLSLSFSHSFSLSLFLFLSPFVS